MDLLRAAKVRANVTAVTITGGDRAHSNGAGQWHVPKRELLTGLEALLECGELRIAAKLREAGRLVKEFEGIQMEARVNGRWKMEGEQDDLVLALSLACWRAKRPQNGFGSRRLPGI
jgi:hypothetical protein